MEEQVLAAIHVLYHEDDATRKTEANRWLEFWQTQDSAWTTADRILHSSTATMDALYFCAQTLRTKVQKDFQRLKEIQPSAIGGLRESLLNLVLKFAKGAPPVRTQLCLAVASLGVHWESQNWGESGIVMWLAQALGRAPQDVAQPCMLELLSVLPQEAHSHQVSVHPSRRKVFVMELKAVAPHALDILTRCINQEGGTRQGQVLEAFSSWLKLTGGQGITGEGLAHHPLVQYSVRGLASAEFFEESVDALCELIFLTVAEDHSGIKPDMMPLVQLIVPAVMQLRPRFTVARQRAEAALQGKEDDVQDEFDDDEDSVKGMARLFAEVGEAYAPLIAGGGPDVAAPVEALLDVSAYPDLSISSISFNFWHRLTAQLVPLNGTPQDPAKKQLFIPAYDRLVNTFRHTVRYPDNWITLTKSEQRDFHRSRKDVEDVLECASQVMGPERTIDLLLQFFTEIRQYQQQQGGGEGLRGDFPWRPVEAGLFCIRAIRMNPPPAGHTPLSELLRATTSTFSDHPHLAYPSCLLIGAYSSWLERSLAQGACTDLLLPLLQFSARCLTNDDAAAAAARSLRHLCDECGSHMGQCMDALAAIYQQALGAGAGALLAGKKTGGLPLMEDDVILVIEAVTRAVTSATPPEHMTTAVSQLCAPLVSNIEQCLQRVVESTDPNVSLSLQHPYLLPMFDRLASVFACIPQPTVVAELLGSCWRLIDGALSRAGTDEKAIERLLRTLRYGLKHSGKACGAMLPLLLEVLPSGFQRTSHSAFMYVVSELVKIFGDDPTHDASMGPIVQQLLTQAAGVLGSLDNIEANPELGDDTFLLASRVLTYCPRLLVNGQLLPLLVDTAMMGMLVQHRDAFLSIISFLCRSLMKDTVAKCPNPQEAEAMVQATITPRGGLIIKLLLAGAAGALPSGRVPDLTDLLVGVLKKMPQQGMSWLVEALKVLPSSAVQASDAEAMVGAAEVVARGGMGQEEKDLEDTLFEFGDVCGLTKQSQEACLQALLPQQLLLAVQRRGR